MSRFCGNKNSAPIIAAAGQWRDECLLGGGSIFTDDSIWNVENLGALERYFVNNPDEGTDDFLTKLENQLEPAGPSAKQLAAEIMWLMLLCLSNISSGKKREIVSQIHSWSGLDLSPDHPQLTDAVLGGIGSAGPGYNTHRWREVTYCIDFVRRFQELPRAQQESLLADSWNFAKWLERVPNNESRQFRHMLLFMLFPDDFDRIFGRSHRRLVAKSFSNRSAKEIAKLSAVELDRLLAQVRQEQVAEFETEELDFYVPPLRDLWNRGKTTTYLLTWNPAKWSWESFLEDRALTHSGKTAKQRWSCHSISASVGDKAYLLRTGDELRGIVAVGNIVSAPYKAPHWDSQRAAAGDETTFVDVEFTKILDPRQDVFIPSAELKKITSGDQEWSPRQSGIEIKPKAAAKLDKLWLALPSTHPPEPEDGPIPEATNLILYGPPGTGKTYRLKQRATDYTQRATSASDWRDSILEEMTWFEVIFAALHASGRASKVNELMDHEFVRRKAKLLGRTKYIGNQLWSSLQTHTRLDSTTVNHQKRHAPYVFDKDAESRWSLVDDWQEECAGIIEAIEKIERGPSSTDQVIRRYEFVTFHQAYSYEDFVEGIRPQETEAGSGDITYSVQPGVFRRICQAAKNDAEHRYAIFIDEINRGNIAKILGELITLIEPDKRAVYDSEGRLVEGMEATLPYSGDRFGVPKNLDVIATMNTADRSIALLDTALRRRFRFEELMPDPGVISGATGDGQIPDGEGGTIDLRALLTAINKRMKFMLHRDQTLGHAYFTDVKDFATLKKVVLQQVVPLLQEYFYDDWHRIQLVLRDVGPAGEKLEPQLICHASISGMEALGIDHEDFEDSIDYWIAPEAEITPDAIRKVYEDD